MKRLQKYLEKFCYDYVGVLSAPLIGELIKLNCFINFGGYDNSFWII